MNRVEINNTYGQKTTEREDAPVLGFLRSLPRTNTTYLELACGTGRFPLLVKNDASLSHILVSAIEINQDLVDIVSKKGIDVIQGDITSLPYKDETFDIVHASHIIEHFGYPNIATVLDEMFRVVKRGGYVIIRSPLMHPNFYNDLDHIRPYPPKAILHYFSTEQQQRVGATKIRLILSWSRRQALHLRLGGLPGSTSINTVLKALWNRFEFPRATADGYVAVFQKQ